MRRFRFVHHEFTVRAFEVTVASISPERLRWTDYLQHLRTLRFYSWFLPPCVRAWIAGIARRWIWQPWTGIRALAIRLSRLSAGNA